ncbi:hypothetical protein [Nocardioides sp. CFH 31398]|uniref:hypothetical protein n=1 Tax=Nocardioides sp. CFH 31398 TaxID=2919579 RepID=UPI001F05AF20|nr:hypothetical protein [Nocardioides sp. CFH 31398]MCH1865600.1 hypothetical protein [Nocardioides sp. CFH 31398]
MSRAVVLRLLGALLVAVLVGGLLGMHTLGLHGTAHGGHGTDAVHAGAHVGGTDGDHAAVATHGTTGHQDTGVPADGMAMACLFLLVVAGALLLLPRLRGGLRRGLTLPRPPPGGRVLPVLVVDGRPPPALAWAVVRC